ncbi:hypothetical protein [Emticicia sp. TH156]|uniref:hypothetical protein n=1 Tax=Emticicia sp. TH156 TaxID=2067454 RepID=UPI000C75BB1C|nr:hypothetical protein [Emticicia sp. TH156]PLK44201.1 hypothetical protein C0V77_10390 [Emticicia sp. TH156]
MRKYLTLIFIVVFQSCKSSIKQKIEGNTVDHNNRTAFSSDSLKLISSLYQKSRIIEYSTIQQGLFTHRKDNKTQKIVATVNFSGLNLSYNIVFEDTSHIYSQRTFVPSEDYQYLNSYIVIGKDTLNLDGIKSLNDSIKVEPINLWYGDDFGIHGKRFKGNQEIILLRGLNMFCNGSNCNNYKILLIIKGSNGTSVHYINTRAIYPYDFENTMLFKTKTNEKPSFFIIDPSLSNIDSTQDFELYTIQKDGKITTVP